MWSLTWVTISPTLISLNSAGEFLIILPISGVKEEIPKKNNIKNKHNHAKKILKKLPASKIIICLKLRILMIDKTF